MLQVSLVNDSLSELRETFYVRLGRQNSRLGSLEPILRIQAEIRDDD